MMSGFVAFIVAIFSFVGIMAFLCWPEPAERESD